MRAIFLIFGALLLAFAGCSQEKPITSSDARSSEVTFLPIPHDATAIRFWKGWGNRIAVFKTTEPAFRKMFPTVTFQEIAEARSYPITGFGNSEVPPWKPSTEERQVTNGIIYEKIGKNGGGETIIYDRATETGYYNYARW